MTIGERIKFKRKEKGWSQRELAAKMGYSHHSTLARIEANQVDISQTRITQFAEVLSVSVAFLMGWEEIKKNNDVKTDIVVRLRTDEKFYSLMENINRLNDEQLASIKQVVDAFLSMKS